MNRLRITDFDAVAFDLEGTLADTIPTHNSTRKKAFEQHGFGHITDEEHARGSTYGSSYHDIMGGVLHAAGIVDKSVPFHQNQTVLDIISTKRGLFTAAADEGFDAMPGAFDFVKKIAALFENRMAIVTSSEERFIYPFLERFYLREYFADSLIIGHESVIGENLEVKPSGDPYLLAMKRMGAKSLLVFEDTISGVASGKRAGATVIALCFDAHNAELFRGDELEYPPDYVVDTYEEASALLGID